MIGKLSIEDALFVATINLPAAGATGNSETQSLDLGNDATNNSPGCVEMVLEVQATPNLATGATLTLTVLESADNVNFAPQPTIAQLVITGPANGGGVYTTFRFHLPSTAKRYLAFQVAASAASGNVTAQTATLKAKF